MALLLQTEQQTTANKAVQEQQLKWCWSCCSWCWSGAAA